MRYSIILQIGNLTEHANRDNPQRNRLYDIWGIAPCVHCMGGGNLEPLILLKDEI